MNELKNIQSAISTNSYRRESGTEYYRRMLDYEIDNVWQYASDVYTILQEKPYGSGKYVSKEVRLTSVKTPDTGYKNVDDYKRILFKHSAGEETGSGSLFHFADNYWIATVTDLVGQTTDSVVVTRCNNYLKWIDENGLVHCEPCWIDYKVSGNNNNRTVTITSSSGMEKIYVQRNERTKTIRSNQRFLFGVEGQWVAFKVAGNGIRNFINSKTGDENSHCLVEINVNVSEVNLETDDLINGIADYSTSKIDCNMNLNYIENFVGYNTTLSVDVVQNGVILCDKIIRYYSLNSSVATVDELGLVRLIGVGETTIQCTVQNKDGVVIHTIDIPVVSNPKGEELVKEIVLLPNVNYILEDKTVVFECYVAENDKHTDELLTYSLDVTSVPKSYYKFKVIDNNHFAVQNVTMYLKNKLKINITSESGLKKELEIELRGAY